MISLSSEDFAKVERTGDIFYSSNSSKNIHVIVWLLLKDMTEEVRRPCKRKVEVAEGATRSPTSLAASAASVVSVSTTAEERGRRHEGLTLS